MSGDQDRDSDVVDNPDADSDEDWLANALKPRTEEAEEVEAAADASNAARSRGAAAADGPAVRPTPGPYAGAHARVWRARTSRELEPAYIAAVKGVVLPHLAESQGYRGALFMGHDGDEGRDLLVLTFWDSAASAGALGTTSVAAYVPEEVRVTLEALSETVDIYGVLVDERLRS